MILSNILSGDYNFFLLSGVFILGWWVLYFFMKKHFSKKNTNTDIENKAKKKSIPPNLKDSLPQVNILPKPANNLSTKLKELSSGEIDWPEFSLAYERMNPHFVENFRGLNINHTPNALKHSICLRMNLSLKETASVLNVSISSVKNARNRLKKQLDLGPTESVSKYINSL